MCACCVCTQESGRINKDNLLLVILSFQCQHEIKHNRQCRHLEVYCNGHGESHSVSEAFGRHGSSLNSAYQESGLRGHRWAGRRVYPSLGMQGKI